MQQRLLNHINRILNEIIIKHEPFDGFDHNITTAEIKNDSFLIIALESFLNMDYKNLADNLGAFIADDSLVIPMPDITQIEDWVDKYILLGTGDSQQKTKFIKWLQN